MDADATEEGQADPGSPDDAQWAAFGRAFLESAVTAERVAQLVAGLVGPVVEFGPVPVGPRGMATATATGEVDDVRGHRRSDADPVVVTVTVTVEISVQLGDRTLPVTADLGVRVRLRPRPSACPTPMVIVDVDPIASEDIDVTSHLGGLAGVFLRRLVDLDAEIRHQVRTWVAELLDSEAGRAARCIDVAAVVELAFDHGLITAATRPTRSPSVR